MNVQYRKGLLLGVLGVCYIRMKLFRMMKLVNQLKSTACTETSNNLKIINE